MVVHAEDHDIVQFNYERFKAEGRTAGWNMHLVHSKLSESLSFRRAIGLAAASGAGIYFVHTSARDGVEAVMEARAKGLPVVFPLTVHPDVSGRPQVLLMLERLIEYIRGIRAYAGARWKGWQKSSGAVIRSRADPNRFAQNAIGGCDELRKIPSRILQGHGGE
jgi:hypothetical protein